MDLSTGQEVHGKHFPLTQTLHSSVELTIQFSYLQMRVILYWVSAVAIVQMTFATSSTHANIDLLYPLRVSEARKLTFGICFIFWYFYLVSEYVNFYCFIFLSSYFFVQEIEELDCLKVKIKENINQSIYLNIKLSSLPNCINYDKNSIFHFKRKWFAEDCKNKKFCF